MQQVEPDRVAAAELVAQARAHLESARLDGIDAQSAYGIAYQAALKAMVAALPAEGLRVGSAVVAAAAETVDA